MRRQRRELSAAEQQRHAVLVSRRLSRACQFRTATHIALYLAANGELDTGPIIDICRRTAKRIYLPVLHPFRHGRLLFCEWRKDALLRPNRFGILEPDCRRHGGIALRALDLVLVPLVAFDSKAQRIGMGGGYYDRTLEKARRTSAWPRPRLIGLAHELQRAPQITAQPWDVPLDAVITEAGCYQPRNSFWI